MRHAGPIACSLLLAAAATAQQFAPPPMRLPWSAAPLLGTAPAGFAFCDLDQDGRQDLIACDAAAVRTFRRQANGSLAPFLPTLTGPGGWPVVRDLDGDGDLDVVLGPQAPNGYRILMVLRRDPSAWIALPQMPLAVTPVVVGMDVGDVDGDGAPDIVASPLTTANQPQLVLLRNPGNGTLAFAADATPFPTGLPSGLWPRLGDVDGDGDLDLVGSRANGGVVLLRNNGGTFVDDSAALPPHGAGYAHHGLVDLDGDGHLDIVASAAAGGIDVLWGSAAGFAWQPSVATVTARALLPYDADGDGDLDLAVERPGIGIDLLQNDGSRRFTLRTAIAAPVASLATGDFEGDGRDDLVFRTVAHPPVTQVGSLAPLSLATIPALTRAVAADWDGNGQMDLLLHAGAVYLRRDDDYDRRAVTVPVWTQGATAVDGDGDGDLDLVAIVNTALVFSANDGTGAFAPAVTILPDLNLPQPLLRGSTTVRMADVDGDGDADVLYQPLGLPSPMLLLRNLGGHTWGAPSPAVAIPTNGGLAAGDFDGDGDIDVLIGHTTSSQIAVLTNDGLGNFQVAQVLNTPAGSRVEVLDLDGDGDLDAVTWSNDTRILRNDGTGTFTEVVASPPLPTNLLPIVGDLDADGFPDLVDRPSLRLLHNDGTAHFTLANRVLAAAPVANEFQVVDIDADGDNDLLGDDVRLNLLRQLVTPEPPQLGSVLSATVYSNPGVGALGVAVLGAAVAAAPAPIAVPGFAGTLQLDTASLTILTTIGTDQIGASSSFVPLPNDPQLVGLRVWLQAALLPAAGQPSLTNVVAEVLH